MKHPTEKNNKSEILSAYKELFKKYESLAGDKKTAKQRIVEETNKELIEKIENGVQHTVSDVAERYIRAAQELEFKMNEGHLKYVELTAAIKLKQDELAELFGIEKEAYNMVALKEAQKAEKDAFEAEMQEQHLKLSQNVVDSQRVCENMISDTEKKQKEMEDEFKYNFAREKRLKQDELADVENDVRKKILSEREVLNKEKEDFSKEKKDLESALTALEEAKEEIEAKAKKELAIEINSIKRSYENEKKLIEAETKAERDKRTYEIGLLNNKVEELKTANVALEVKLENAYAKLQELARETVQSNSKDQLIKELSGIAKTHQSK